MKSELKTLDVLDKLRALHQHYITLKNSSKEKGALVSATKYGNMAQAVANAIHEVELMSGAIE
ncbi:hypothetical protein [Vibrio sp. CyArs1]|uniref:hypothetical protein n=1 Tax=Vibrio sp. CyArs1 TaxID=2682577 RepID=UPI001F066CDA|nr:hypothetical protein [Vibrio sp. CyArs1]